MIGVVANEADQEVIREFFELFKTPWEFCNNDRTYDVIICASGEDSGGTQAKLTVIYVGQISQAPVASDRAQLNWNLIYQGSRLPVYGGCATFEQGDGALLSEQSSGRPALLKEMRGEAKVVYVGYDLFAETRALLTRGQPVANAEIPALELHIRLLRDLIINSGIAVMEIPPVPAGYRFIACLTHDVDHPLLRNHGFDHTTVGFLYRATVGTLLGVARRRRTIREALRNLWAAAKLPFVQFGAARDFWATFDRYTELEQGARSSFFIIPFRGRPGRRTVGHAPRDRAAGYGAADVAQQMKKLTAAGCEIGLHGIDAWLDSTAGRSEAGEICRIAGNGEEIGARMHWLYFDDESSPRTLEEAGIAYDSTVGYNNNVGYRAGTSQVYKPLGTRRLLELPLHIMDTALFYPTHLNLSRKEAWERVQSILDNAQQFGGCVTVNWHDRSIAPERCWDGFYVELVGELKNRGAWFATAGEAVAWFQGRRSAKFEDGKNGIWFCETAAVKEGLPALALRIANG